MPAVGPDDPDIEFGAINMRRHLEAMEVVSYLLEARFYVFVLVGLATTLLVILLFAVLFYACEPHCFNDIEFTFEQMMWMSAHTLRFTTMGNPYVRCGAGQFLVILENYAALLVQLLLGGVVLIKVMTPRAKLRFGLRAELCNLGHPSNVVSMGGGCEGGRLGAPSAHSPRKQHTLSA
eukprot:1200976-Prymnesium_polylepis.1